MAAISARLHGMPLAIELAAARIKLLSPDAILVRLDHQLDVLAAGARDLPERQQTLRGAIAWSYDLLDDGGKRLLDRLSVFAAGCDLASAEAICGPSSEIGGDILDGLMALVDQSLVKVEETAGGETRFRLLDTIREYAAERLEADGETDLIRARHRDWYVALVPQAAAELSGPDQRRWLDRLELEHDDIRAVLDRAVAAPDPPVAIGVAFSMWRFWQKHGHLAEARRRLEAMESAPWSHDDPRLRAKLDGGARRDLLVAGRPRRDDAALPRGARDLADARRRGRARQRLLQRIVHLRRPMSGSGRRTATPIETGLLYLERARDIVPPDRRQARRRQRAVGPRQLPLLPEITPGNGEEQFRETLTIFGEVGDLTMEAWALHMLGTSLLRNGHVDEARENIAHAIRHFHAAGDASGLTLTFDDMSAVAVADGDLPRAARLRARPAT